MRIVMLGTGPFAVPTFAALLDAGHDVPALITRPTPPSRGHESASGNPMRDLAERRHIAVLAPQSVNTPESREQLAQMRPELLVVCDFGQILSQETLAVAPHGGINLHGSLLPKYRGAAPVQWAILNGDRETGVTVIHMTPRLDGGPALAIRKTAIGPDETMPELEDRLSKLGVEAVMEALSALQSWDRRSSLGVVQDQNLATKAPRLKKQDGAVVWTQSAEQIRNQVRALKPWPGTYTHWLRSQGAPLRLILDRVQALGPKTCERAESRSPVPGEVIQSDGQNLVIAANEGAVAIDRLQPAGKRVMEVGEFLRGYAVQVGDRFGPA